MRKKELERVGEREIKNVTEKEREIKAMTEIDKERQRQREPD